MAGIQISGFEIAAGIVAALVVYLVMRSQGFDIIKELGIGRKINPKAESGVQRIPCNPEYPAIVKYKGRNIIGDFYDKIDDAQNWIVHFFGADINKRPEDFFIKKGCIDIDRENPETLFSSGAKYFTYNEEGNESAKEKRIEDLEELIKNYETRISGFKSLVERMNDSDEQKIYFTEALEGKRNREKYRKNLGEMFGNQPPMMPPMPPS